MPKGEPETAATAQRDAARAARNDRAQEVVLLLSWLTRLPERSQGKCLQAHLAPVENAQANSTMNYVVCVHEAGQRLAWRISDFEAMEYFKHLSVKDCARGLSRADKMTYLADMLSKR